MRTELKIYGSGIFYNIDLYDDEPFPLTKEIKQFNEPDSSQSDFTKSIKIPGTQNNNQILSNIFDINHSIINSTATNFNADFNPNLKADCILYREGIPQLRGYLQLIDINILDEHNVYYNIIIIGRNANLFQDLGDKMLNELDLTHWNHDWTLANIESSWTATIGEGYVYPLIDRGFDPKEQVYYADETYPAVYVKTIVDAIFSGAGYRYSSAFFDTERFKRLIIPYTSDGFKKTAAQVNDRTFIMDYDTDTAYTAFSGYVWSLVDFNHVTQDTTPTGISMSKWTVPTGLYGQYIFRTDLKMTAKYTSGFSPTEYPFYIYTRIMVDNGTSIYQVAIDQSQLFFPAPVNTNDEVDFELSLQCPMQYFNAGDIVWVEYMQLPFSYELKFRTGSSFFSSPEPVYNFGANIDISTALPKDFKQADFLKALIKMFNLYFEPDKIDDKKLVIEPRDDFYTSNVIDLTNNLDVSKDVTISPMGALDFKTLEFHQQFDEDEHNKKYNEQFKNDYGYRRVTVSNDFLVEKKIIELPFAPSPLVSFENNNRIITKIRFFNDDKSLNVQAAKPRILYYGGLLDTGRFTYFLTDDRRTPPTNAPTQFAYAGHLDNPYNPTFDLNWNVSEAIFYGIGTIPNVTNGNLYKNYWEKTIKEITDKDSKILKCSMRLTNVQLQNLSFRDYYLIDRQYYRLYKVDVDLNSDEPATCEFLKLKAAPTPTITQGTSNGGVGTFGDGELLPTLRYYNNPKYQLNQDQLIGYVDNVSGVKYLTAVTQNVVIYDDVYLPSPQSGYDFTTNKSIQILVFNDDGGGKKVIDATNGTDVTLAAKTGHTFFTDGTKWYNV